MPKGQSQDTEEARPMYRRGHHVTTQYLSHMGVKVGVNKTRRDLANAMYFSCFVVNRASPQRIKHDPVTTTADNGTNRSLCHGDCREVFQDIVLCFNDREVPNNRLSLT